MKTIEVNSNDLPQAEEARPVRIVAASARGLSHEKSGLPCQDQHRVEALSPELLIVAVADGAGSAARSEIGAAIATQAAVDWLCVNRDRLSDDADDADWERTLREAIEEARERVFAEAAAREIGAHELASTLILAVATPTVVACAQIGDGAAVARDREQRLIALTTPQFGECVNETTFLISSNALSQSQSRVWRGAATHLAVFSDGIQMLCMKLPEGAPHPQFFAPLFNFVSASASAQDAQRQLEDFLGSARIRKFTDDDLTLVLAALPQTLCSH